MSLALLIFFVLVLSARVCLCQGFIFIFIRVVCRASKLDCILRLKTINLHFTSSHGLSVWHEGKRVHSCFSLLKAETHAYFILPKAGKHSLKNATSWWLLSRFLQMPLECSSSQNEKYQQLENWACDPFHGKLTTTSIFCMVIHYDICELNLVTKIPAIVIVLFL